MTERAKDIDDDVRKRGDADGSESATESEHDEKLGAMAMSEIQQIKLAWRRVDADSYGVCTACGGAIAAKRLEALPYATKCVSSA